MSAYGQDLTHLALPGIFTETAYAGVGFGLGFSVMQSPARRMFQLPSAAETGSASLGVSELRKLRLLQDENALLKRLVVVWSAKNPVLSAQLLELEPYGTMSACRLC